MTRFLSRWHKESKCNCITIDSPYNVPKDPFGIFGEVGGWGLKWVLNVTDSECIHLYKEPRESGHSSTAHENWQTHRVKCALGGRGKTLQTTRGRKWGRLLVTASRISNVSSRSHISVGAVTFRNTGKLGSCEPRTSVWHGWDLTARQLKTESVCVTPAEVQFFLKEI